jgi:hypothetical protein
VHWFVTDETNNDYVEDRFFIYGGLVMTDEQMVELSDAVGAIRTKYGYQRGDHFKFHTRARPDAVSIDAAKAAKKEVVEAVERIGIRMIVYVILHNIAVAQTEAVRMNWALNTVTWAYHRLLEREGAKGVFVMDRADEQHVHLAELFQHGIDVDPNRVPIGDRVILLGMTSDNASHISSAVDIALGGFRYCVNAAGGDGSQVVAADIFPPLARIIWGIEVGGTKYIRNYGFHSMPKTEIKSGRFKAIYMDLYGKLDEYMGGQSEPQVEG